MAVAVAVAEGMQEESASMPFEQGKETKNSPHDRSWTLRGSTAMKTRRSVCCPGTDGGTTLRVKRRRCCDSGGDGYFDALPDDIVLIILSRMVSVSSRPSDFISVLLTCKRLRGLALHPMVLRKASLKTFAVRAEKWSEEAHRFLKLCADAGNVEACYTLGMIRFYCLENRRSGASMMARAAMGSHAGALYSLAVIQFNGSGGSRNEKDLRAGVALCARAAFLGDVDAMRELGYCLRDGYGVNKNVAESRRFIVHANVRGIVAALLAAGSLVAHHRPLSRVGLAGVCPLLCDFGCDVQGPESHPANRFLSEWFEIRRVDPLDPCLCSHTRCGRPETRKHEFRRCSVCGAVKYCSRTCQALDWKIRHRAECIPVDRWIDEDGNVVGDDVVAGEAEGDVAMADS